MRNGFVKSSRVLLTLAGIGILSIIIGLLYFSGVASWAVGDPSSPSGFTINRLFFGFNYRILFALGFFLLVIGVFPVLSAADINTTNSIKKIYVHLLLLFGTGILLLFYSVFVYLDRLVVFDEFHTWFDYSIVAAFAIIFSISILLFSVQDSERLWNLKYIFGIFFVIGFLGVLFSMIVYGGYDLGEMISWDFIFILSGFFLFLGFIPMVVTAGSGFRDFLHRLRFLWLIIALISLISFVLAGLIKFEILESSTFLDINWYIFYLFGSLFLVISLVFLATATDLQEIIYKLRYLWLISFFFGIIVVLFSFITILPTSDSFSGITGQFGLEDYFDILYMYGIAIIIFALIFICSIIKSETAEDTGSTGVSSAREFLSESESTTSEMIAYLEIVHKSNEEIIGHFKEALREDKFRPRVYEKLIKQYRESNRSVTSRLDKFRGKSPIISGKEEVSSLFDDVIGPEVTEKAPVPSPEPSIPSPIPSSGPPVPPKTTPSSGPPLPPSPAPSSGLSMPSTPPPSPSAPSIPPATPGMTPGKSPQSPLDLIADARSTSIAELRGEMLKELRRLREIFKEE